MVTRSFALRWGGMVVLGTMAVGIAKALMVWHLSWVPGTTVVQDVRWGAWELGPEHPETEQMHPLLESIGEVTGTEPHVTLSLITGSLPDPRVDAALADVLVNGTESDQLWAVELMANMGSRGVRLAQEVLAEHGDEGALAVSVLARGLPEADAVPAMLALLNAGPRVQALACLELTRLGASGAAEQVAEVAARLSGTAEGALAAYGHDLLTAPTP